MCGPGGLTLHFFNTNIYIYNLDLSNNPAASAIAVVHLQPLFLDKG